MSWLSNLISRGGTSGRPVSTQDLLGGLTGTFGSGKPKFMGVMNPVQQVTRPIGQAMDTIGAQNQANADAAASGQSAQTQAAQAAQDKSEADAARIQQQQATARRLMLLRQNLLRQQGGNVSTLRRNLARSGALNSGSLGAGITQLGNETSGMLAQGTQAALAGEEDVLTRLQEAARDRQFQRDESEKERKNKVALMQLMAHLQRQQDENAQIAEMEGRPGELLGQLLGIGANFGLSRIGAGGLGGDKDE